MAANETSPILTTSQVITNPAGPPTMSEAPVPTIDSVPSVAPNGAAPNANALFQPARAADDRTGTGIENEEVVWEARYAMRNFLGRLVARTALTVAWLCLAVYTWGYSDGSIAWLTILAGIGIGLLWAMLLYRIVLARYGPYYRLTTQRLFVSTGLWRRRRDMLELLGVRDVYTRQTLVERWLSLGTVVVDSSDKAMPTFFLTGVDDPKRVMDLIWHHARSERDRRSVKVEEI